MTTRATTATSPTGAWAPFSQPVFRALWIATLVSNVGSWIQDVAAGWTMTELTDSRLLVALVQAAGMAPLFLLALPAGALADIVDRRRLLLVAQSWCMLAAAGMAAVAMLGILTPGLLLLFVGLVAVGTALTMPAFQAVVPELVPRAMLRDAVTLNGVAINIARAVGPALAGVILSTLGIEWAFLLNAASFLAVILVLWRWRREPQVARLPPEHLLGAIAAGLRHVRHSPPLRVVLARAFLFTSAAAAAWSLLPLVIRNELGLGAGAFGVALGLVGLGAVLGVAVLPWIRRRRSADSIALGAAVAFAGVLAVMGAAPGIVAVAAAMLTMGLAWICVMSTLNASAQMVLPEWVRARGLAAYSMVFAACLALGAVAWGVVAQWVGTPAALWIAAGWCILGCGAAPFLRLCDGETLRLAPTKFLPGHALPPDPETDTGLVQVLVHYRIAPEDADRFRAAMVAVRRARLATGAISWALLRDRDRPDSWTETFAVSSWTEHLRQHDRTTEDDWASIAAARRFHRGEEPPRVEHLLRQ